MLLFGLLLRISHASLFHVSKGGNDFQNHEQKVDYWEENNLTEKCQFCYYGLKYFSLLNSQNKEELEINFSGVSIVEKEAKYFLKESLIFNSRAPPFAKFLFKNRKNIED